MDTNFEYIFFAQKGIQEAYHRLIDKYASVVFLQALIKTESALNAQIITENVFSYVYNTLPDYKQKISFSKWIQIHTLRICNDTFLIKNESTLAKMLWKIKKLPDNYQLPVILYCHYLSIKKVVEILNISKEEEVRLKYFLKNFSDIPKMPKVNAFLCKQKINKRYKKNSFFNAVLLNISVFFLCFYPFFRENIMIITLIPIIIVGIGVKIGRLLQYFLWKRKWQKLLFMVIFCNVLYPQISFLAGVNQQEVKMGDTVTLTLMVIGKTEQTPSFLSTNLKKLAKVRHVITTETQNNKNCTINKYIYNFRLQAEGKAKIFSIQLKTPNKIYHQKEIPINITSQTNNKTPPFLLFLSSPLQGLVFESIPLKINYYHPYQLRLKKTTYEVKKSSFYNCNSLNYVVENYERRKGFIYKKITYHLLVTPLKPGNMALSLDNFYTTVLIPNKENLFDKIFGKNKNFEHDFFRKKPLSKEFGAKEISISLESSIINIQIEKLPKQPEKANTNNNNKKNIYLLLVCVGVIFIFCLKCKVYAKIRHNSQLPIE